MLEKMSHLNQLTGFSPVTARIIRFQGSEVKAYFRQLFRPELGASEVYQLNLNRKGAP